MFCMAFYHYNFILIQCYWFLLLDSVLEFLALVSCILWKAVTWLLSQFNWLVATWRGISVWGIPKQIRNSFRYVYICVYIYVCICMFVLICMNEQVCIYVYMYMGMCLCIYMYICMCICMYIYTLLFNF